MHLRFLIGFVVVVTIFINQQDFFDDLFSEFGPSDWNVSMTSIRVDHKGTAIQDLASPYAQDERNHPSDEEDITDFVGRREASYSSSQT
jgi:hypothetical protein